MGLRGRMALSYVLVTAAAVLVVEAVLLGRYVPSIMAGSDLQARLAAQAGRDAKILTRAVRELYAKKPKLPYTELLGESMKTSLPDLSLGGTPPGYNEGVPIRFRSDRAGIEPVEVLVDADGQIVSSSALGSYAPGDHLPIEIKFGSGKSKTPIGDALWSANPVLEPGQFPRKQETLEQALAQRLRPLGWVYVQAPPEFGGESSGVSVAGLITPGAAVLVLGIPVGLLFGLLSTRRLIGRVRRLADVTGAVAAGDFRPRVPVTHGDEVGQLEASFNTMTARLEQAIDGQRSAAQAEARQTERARIARELHDSISQDLFSLSLLAAGMRRAAPDRLKDEAEAMERTSARAMREMQALLLELRPVALEDAGLVPALEELCHAYETRLGVRVETVLDEVTLSPAAEHAVLRLVQEALGNAVKHADPTVIRVRLTPDEGTVRVEITDDGPGFDPSAAHYGMGLRLMRERVEELGGVFEIRNQGGTTVMAALP